MATMMRMMNMMPMMRMPMRMRMFRCSPVTEAGNDLHRGAVYDREITTIFRFCFFPGAENRLERLVRANYRFGRM